MQLHLVKNLQVKFGNKVNSELQSNKNNIERTDPKLQVRYIPGVGM